MSEFDYDLFVIGGGSGGVRCARMAGAFGAKVAICEERYWGGTCVNVGCVPKKLMVYGASFSDVVDDARGFGWGFEAPTLDWGAMIRNKDAEIQRLNGIYERLLVRFGVQVIGGRGEIVGPHGVRVSDRVYTARRILIATGGRPQVPDVPGVELGITSDQAFSLPARPDRVVIVGSGYIGVEFAGIFRGYGAQVSMICRNPLPLRGFDMDVRRHLSAEMARRGVDFVPDATLAGIERTGPGLAAILGDGRRLEGDCVFLATGRSPNTGGLGLDAAGVALKENGGIQVDERFQTSAPSIYAVGDVLGDRALTPVALAEGMVVARNLFGGMDVRMDYDDIPTAVFSNPPVGTVGLTEAQARARYGEVVLYRSDFRPMMHTMTGRDARTMMKIVVDAASDRVVGCHMVGPDAGEIIQGLAVAMKCGATKAQFDATIGIHPTAAEEFVTMRTPASG